MLPEAGAARGIGTERSKLFLLALRPRFLARVEFGQHLAREEFERLADMIEQAMARKEKIAPLTDDKIPSFVALGRQVAATTQLTPEQEAARRRLMAAAQIPLENPEKAPAAE
jgi:methylphosphotriester-DNA--protein-cysteine methyltransferase